MKYIQYTGLGIFILAFFSFIAILFMSTFEITDENLTTISPMLKEQHREVVTSELAKLKGKEYHKFAFISAVGAAIEKANNTLSSQYGLAPEVIDQYVNTAMTQGENEFTVTQESYDAANKLIEEEMKETVISYSNWLVGQNASSEDELKQKVKNGILGAVDGYVNNFKIFSTDEEEYKFTLAKNAASGIYWDHKYSFFLLIIVFGSIGALIWIFPAFYDGMPGIKHNHIYHNSVTSRGAIGIAMGAFLILFYIALYYNHFFIAEWIGLVDPVSQWMRNGVDADRWFMYGFLYTIAIFVMGIRMFTKYRHSKYHLIRTSSVMFFQTAFAFILPQILHNFRLPAQDLKNMWPLDYSFFFDYRLDEFTSTEIGVWMMVWGIALFVLGVPIITYFYGKRWYCSWVCGCGGLAETLGDPYRQLSSKKLSSWQIERYLIHGVLVFALFMTALVLYTYFSGASTIMGINSYTIRGAYGLYIGGIFAGVIGTGFYPLMGNRMWCRFGCPLAAYLGLVQRFKSRFRITTNGGQCISCGNCSTYCEMGIDVRAYAQRGQNIVRSSCVGCGVCAAVCPRGVLSLENGPNTDGSRMDEFTM